jgi:hypothetical protein
MSINAVPSVLGNISHLLLQAEKAPSLEERAAAVKQLWAIVFKLEADLTEIKKGVCAGLNRRVEVMAYRATLVTLIAELAQMGEQRPEASPKIESSP